AAAAPDREEQLAGATDLVIADQLEVAEVRRHRCDAPEAAIDPEKRARRAIRTDDDELRRAVAVRCRPQQTGRASDERDGLAGGPAIRGASEDAERQWPVRADRRR